MHQAWRIVKKRYAETAFDGDGARRYGGRWNSPGQPVVYASGTLALATLEVLAGISSSRPLTSYVVILVEFEAALVEAIELEQLPSDWNHYPPRPSTQKIGDQWLVERRTVVLSVPSAIVPQELNCLLNPLHPDFGQLRMGHPRPFEFDSRLLP